MSDEPKMDPEQKPIEVRMSGDNSPRCITISSSDQKKVVHNIVVFLNEQSSIPEIEPLDHHKNVAMDTELMEVLHGEMKCSSLDIYKESLKQLILSGEDLSEDFRKELLLQITRGLAHVHECGETFGEIKPDHIYISCHKKNAVLTNVWMNRSLDHGHDKADDIVCLGELFYFVLTGIENCSSNNVPDAALKCTEKRLAKDLLERMIRQRPEQEIDYLKAASIEVHPFFWSENQKITFICDAYDSIKHLDQEDDNLETRGKTEVFDGEWFKELKLRKEEATAIKENSRKMTGKAKQISHDTILNLAQGIKKNRKVSYTTYLFDEYEGKLAKLNSIIAKEWGQFVKKIRESDNRPSTKDPAERKKRLDEAVVKVARDGDGVQYEVFDKVILVKDCEEAFRKDSLCDLLRFFRNRKAHYCESNQNIQRCFQSYPTGFWKFFSSRYPNLLPFVYENRGKFELIRKIHQEKSEGPPLDY